MLSAASYDAKKMLLLWLISVQHILPIVGQPTLSPTASPTASPTLSPTATPRFPNAAVGTECATDNSYRFADSFPILPSCGSIERCEDIKEECFENSNPEELNRYCRLDTPDGNGLVAEVCQTECRPKIVSKNADVDRCGIDGVKEIQCQTDDPSSSVGRWRETGVCADFICGKYTTDSVYTSELEEAIIQKIGSSKLRDRDPLLTPQYWSKKWLRTQKVCTNDDGLVDKYAIGVLYYSWGLGYQLNQYGSADLCNEWDSDIIQCSEGRIVGLNFEKRHIYGTIPMEIGYISELSQVKFGTNFLYGQIPQEIGMLQKLKHLDMVSNALTGELPVTLFRLQSLAYLDLGKNKFRGTLSTGFGAFENLTHLSLHENKFYGQIPQDFGKLKVLENLYLDGNHLGGPCQKNICEIFTLKYFSADCSVDCACVTKCFPAGSTNGNSNEVWGLPNFGGNTEKQKCWCDYHTKKPCVYQYCGPPHYVCNYGCGDMDSCECDYYKRKPCKRHQPTVCSDR